LIAFLYSEAGRESRGMNSIEPDRNNPVDAAAPRDESRARTRGMSRAERWLRSVVQNSSDIIAIFEDDGTVRYVSPAVERILGYRPEELVGTGIFEHLHPQDVEWVSRRFAEALENSAVMPPAELRIQAADGSWRYMETILNNLLDDPDIRGIIINARDVTERKEAEEALKESERRFSSVVSDAHAYVYRCLNEPGYPNEFASDYALELTGYPPEDLLVGGKTRFGDLIVEEDRQRVWEEIQEALAEHRSFELRYAIRRRDGEIRHVQEYGRGIFENEGEVVALEGLVYDITELAETEHRLRTAETRYRTLVEHIPGVSYVQQVGHYHTLVYVSPQIEAITGYSPEDFVSDPELWYGIIHPDDRERVEAEDARTDETGEPFRMEYRLVHRDGRVVWVRDEAILVKDPEDRPSFWQGVMTDVTERKALEERLQHQALHDSLTGLANRQLFVDRLGQALRRTRRRPKRQPAVLFMDLDNFKVINDSLGHELGNELLVAVAERLRGLMRPEDTLARFGGDEFTVLIEDVEDPTDTVRVVERITQVLREPFILEGRELLVKASVGIALSDARMKSSPEELLRNADVAMYRAKEDAAGYRMFDPAMYERVLERLELENDLRHALEREEFRVYYQPKFRLGQARIEGIEALVRWEHPQRGLMLPEGFIPIAEEMGLTIPIGGWVMKEACRQAKEWQECCPSEPPVSICVNLSAGQVRHPGLLHDVRSALSESDLDAGSLILEITEGALLKDTEVIETVFGALKALGVKLAIDDFGREYSSLSYLKRLPVDGLKIDGSFIGSLAEDPANTTIVEAVISLAHSLGLEVTGEGVETAEQLEHLRRMGCDLVQGDHLARPLPSEEVEPLLADRLIS
jgi:diguanylate cyclase (GGDEF)-like protein/PAS domain S-box-containing protein